MNSSTHNGRLKVSFSLTRLGACLILMLSAVSALLPIRAQADTRDGKKVVDMVCSSCHATGADGAPRMGDVKAWSPRASQGLSSLTLHAIHGIRKMPAHGGHPELSDLEIARAVTYMVNQSGGNWTEPTSQEELAKELSGEQVVAAQCVTCHGQGLNGAPKIGDTKAWVERIARGLGNLVRSAIRGHGGMPPRGGRADLTDNELRSAILYMYNPASVSKRPTPPAAQPSQVAISDPNHKIADGIEMYLGFMSAKSLQALPKNSPERHMHGHVPKGAGYQHVNVSLFDEKSGKPINDARIEMDLDVPGQAGTSVKLEPMLVGAGSYGNYVKTEPGSTYFITIHIKRPGAARPVEVKLEHKF